LDELELAKKGKKWLFAPFTDVVIAKLSRSTFNFAFITSVNGVVATNVGEYW
jgi:hypothetical protein